MTSRMAWRDEWLLGIETFDTDHMEMMRLINSLFPLDESNSSGATVGGEPFVADQLERVIACLRLHFDREETFQQSIGYPGIEEHKTEHSLEIAELTEMERVLRETRASCIDEAAAESLKRWFLDHVIAEDRLYAEYYFEQLGAIKTGVTCVRQ
mgnify:CR=1 FL=1